MKRNMKINRELNLLYNMVLDKIRKSQKVMISIGIILTFISLVASQDWNYTNNGTDWKMGNCNLTVGL